MVDGIIFVFVGKSEKDIQIREGFCSFLIDFIGRNKVLINLSRLLVRVHVFCKASYILSKILFVRGGGGGLVGSITVIPCNLRLTMIVL